MSMQDLLEHAAARPQYPLDLHATWEAGRGRRRRRRLAGAGAVTVGAIAVVAVVLTVQWREPVTIDPFGPEDSAPPTTSDVAPYSGAPLFDSETDTTLLIDDGEAGLLAIDLDTGRRVTLALPDQEVGDDAPFQLWKMGSWLVRGSGTIWASAPGAGLPDRELGRATFFVPASAPDQLWLVDYPDGESGEGVAAWRLVDASGVVLHEAIGEPGWFPLRGMNGGLAVHNIDLEVRLYDPDQGAVVEYLGGREGALADVSSEHVVWCYQLPCTRMGIRSPGHESFVELGADEFVDPTQVWLADGGAHLAAFVNSGGSWEVRVYQVGDPVSPLLARLPVEDSHAMGDWDETGTQFFFTQYAGEFSDEWRLGRWSRSRPETIELIRLPQQLTGRGDVVTYPSSTLKDLFTGS